MRLIGANLTNFCQHKSLSVNFSPGLTAVIGKNGSGKSNLIKAIYSAITGDYGRNDGVKNDNISQFATAGESSKINVTLEHGASTIDITRSLRPVATRLKITSPDTDEQIITKAQEATETIFNIIGVSPRMLADYVFVDQWSIFDFLSMMPAERAKAFQRLFRTERAEALWRLVGEYQDKIFVPTPGIDKDAVNSRLAINRCKQSTLKWTFDELSTEINACVPATYKKTINDWVRKQELSRDINRISAKIEISTQELEKIDKDLTELSSDELELTNAVKVGRAEYELEKQQLGSLASYEAIELTRRKLTLQLLVLETEEKALVKPVRPDTYVGTDQIVECTEWWKYYDDLKNEIHVLKHQVDVLATADNCPTCGTPVAALVGQQATRLHALQGKQKQFDALTLVANANIEYSRAKDYFDRLSISIKRDRHTYKDQLDQLEVVPRPNKSKEELQKSITIHEKLEAALEDYRKAINELKIKQQCKLNFITQMKEEVAEKRALHSALSVTEEDAKLAYGMNKRYEQISQTHMETKLIINNCESLIRDDEKALEDLLKTEFDAVTAREWINHCTDIRNILHRDSLPRLVAQNFLELMQDEINNILSRFDSPFHVLTDESLSFIAAFKDGRKIPAARLSGGEKVLLALAFRVAVNDIFARDLGLLVLDEPTAGLDEGNLACLRIAITRLKELSSSRGLQVIMITHECELNNLFDHVIEIGKE